MVKNVKIDFPASYRFLNIVSASIEALLEGLPERHDKEALVFQVKLAVQEACTNIIDHAYGGRGSSITAALRGDERIEASLCLQEEPCQLWIDLYDSGTSFHLGKIQSPNPGSDLESVQEHGYGLFLIHELMSQVRYEPSDTQPQPKNHWQMVKEIA